MIKAIETKYKGYRFRSRLEARWAIFFDRLGIVWEYEPEGFELPSGKYLPDFKLISAGSRTWNAYAEIKHGNLEDSEHDAAIEKCHELREMTGRPVLFIEGDPVERRVTIIQDLIGRHAIRPEGGFFEWCCQGWGNAIAAAAAEARAARFEHGETPSLPPKTDRPLPNPMPVTVGPIEQAASEMMAAIKRWEVPIFTKDELVRFVPGFLPNTLNEAAQLLIDTNRVSRVSGPEWESPPRYFFAESSTPPPLSNDLT